MTATFKGKRSTSGIEHILLDIFVFALIVAGIFHWHCSQYNSRLLQLYQDNEIEVSWEKQHVHELEETVNNVSSSYDELLKQNMEISRRLSEMEKEQELADEENARLRIEVNTALANLRGTRGFKVGDVVELSNPSRHDHNKLQVLPPFKVDKRSSDGIYQVTRVTDGITFKHIEEKFIKHYAPYPPGTEAVCNIGEFGLQQERFVPCEIVTYYAKSSYGVMMLQGQYKVHVKAFQEIEERDVEIPVWKVMGKR
mmetsp:Transcript_15943/g.32414  ORF Transcript_15943/g.32414 Transcript_15943/m.32414 type:complete len:254 (+) Transcript_15943:61-822(+)